PLLPPGLAHRGLVPRRAAGARRPAAGADRRGAERGGPELLRRRPRGAAIRAAAAPGAGRIPARGARAGPDPGTALERGAPDLEPGQRARRARRAGLVQVRAQRRGRAIVTARAARWSPTGSPPSRSRTAARCWRWRPS